jgi:hypothetical protein
VAPARNKAASSKSSNNTAAEGADTAGAGATDAAQDPGGSPAGLAAAEPTRVAPAGAAKTDPAAAPVEEAPAPAPEAGKAAGDAAALAEAAERDAAEEALLAPLPAPPDAASKSAAQVKRVPPPKKPRPVVTRGNREPTQLQREWRDTNALFTRLKNQYSCLQLGLWCTRYASIRNEVEAAGDVNDTDTLAKVRDMKRDLQARRKELE